ncbi:MAG: hypothetical protein J5517_04805 [Eubacterium sp.]|nr:hypothetical protein [Eubacterium sp.]
MADIKFKDVTPEQFALNLRQLKDEGKVNELVDMIYEAHEDYYNGGMGDEGANARLSETEKFLKELSPVKEGEESKKEGKEINPENVAFLNQIMQAFSEKYYNAVYDAGSRRDAYVEQIKRGKVKGTELVKDEPKTVRKIAHDLVMRDDGVASDAYVHFYRTLNNSLEGKSINGKKAQEINVETSERVYKSIEEKKGISHEKTLDYTEEFENRDYHNSLGFRYKQGELAPGESPFADLPKHLKVVQSCKSAEELEALEDSLNALLDQHDHYEKQIKSTVKVANHLLKEFDSIDWPDKETLAYKDLRYCLEHFTHLGKDYKYESVEIISDKNREVEAKLVKPEKQIYPASAQNAAALIDRSLREMFDNAADKYEDLKEKGMTDSSEFKAAEKMVKTMQNIFQMKENAEKITEAYAKANDGGNLSKVEDANLKLKYIEKAKKLNKLTILPKVGDDAYIRSIDDSLKKLSDSLADCNVKPDESKDSYEKLAASLMEHKRIYKKIRAAESLSDDKLKEKYTKQLATNASAIKKAVKNCKSFEKSTEKTEGLIAGESNRIGTLDELSENLESTVSILKNSAAEVSFDKYIRLHSGKYSGKTVGEKKTNIAKVIAAYSLKKEGKKFSVKDIHKAANEIEEFYCIKTNPDYDTKKGGKERLMDATKDEKSMIREAVNIRVGLYGIKNGKYDDFVRDMNTLKDSMRTSKGRSNEYTALCNAIKEASEMNEKTAGMTEEQKADAFANANIKVVMAVQKYVKGKETVRIQDKGNDAFANSMDALSIVSKYTRHEGKAMNESVIKVVNKINEVRKDNILSDANRFAKGYGAERAKMAHDRRMAAEKSKPKARENVR